MLIELKGMVKNFWSESTLITYFFFFNNEVIVHGLINILLYAFQDDALGAWKYGFCEAQDDDFLDDDSSLFLLCFLGILIFSPLIPSSFS